MIIPNQKVTVGWHSNNRKHFEAFGYKFTFRGDEFEVTVEELNKGSRTEIKCSCNECGTMFFRSAKLAFKFKKHFCSDRCKSLNMKKFPNNPSTKVKFPCGYCGEITLFSKHRHEKLLSGETKNLFCSRKCQGKWNSEKNQGENNPNFNSFLTNCKTCDSEFLVPFYRKETAQFCSDKCKRESSRKRIPVKCGNCEKTISVTPSQIQKSKSGNIFCSNACVGKYNAITRKKDLVQKQCLICNSIYKTKQIYAEKSVTCSKKCQHIWQSKFLVGENANNFNKNITLAERTIKCGWCKKENSVNPYKLKQINSGKESFCSVECFRLWYANDWSQREEWKNESRKRTVQMMQEGAFNHTDTECQLLVNRILDFLNIKYVNEQGFKYYSIDNYLPDYDLAIEVMGTFWHCDPRKYKEINYQRQLDRIKSDKAKQTYLAKKHNINILYLWEDDVLNNSNLIEKLILKYLNTGGNLSNFNSLNYSLNGLEELQVNTQMIVPYQNRDIEDIREIINIFHGARDRTQYDKWISFNCENCGKEKVQLISKYNNSRTHCCSYECSHQLRKGKQVKIN